jgi:DNA repair protein RAD16
VFGAVVEVEVEVEAQHSRHVQTQVTCGECGKKFYPDKLVLHQKYFCGEGARLTAAQALTQRKKKAVKVCVCVCVCVWCVCVG